MSHVNCSGRRQTPRARKGKFTRAASLRLVHTHTHIHSHTRRRRMAWARLSTSRSRTRVSSRARMQNCRCSQVGASKRQAGGTSPKRLQRLGRLRTIQLFELRGHFVLFAVHFSSARTHHSTYAHARVLECSSARVLECSSTSMHMGGHCTRPPLIHEHTPPLATYNTPPELLLSAHSETWIVSLLL